LFSRAIVGDEQGIVVAHPSGGESNLRIVVNGVISVEVQAKKRRCRGGSSPRNVHEEIHLRSVVVFGEVNRDFLAGGRTAEGGLIFGADMKRSGISPFGVRP
jgi:hypothetical protein